MSKKGYCIDYNSVSGDMKKALKHRERDKEKNAVLESNTFDKLIE